MENNLYSIQETNEIPIFNVISDIMKYYEDTKNEFKFVNYDTENLDIENKDNVVSKIEESKSELLNKIKDNMISMKTDISKLSIDDEKEYGRVKIHAFSINPSYDNIKYKIETFINRGMDILSDKSVDECVKMFNINFKTLDTKENLKLIFKDCGEYVITGKIINEAFNTIIKFYEVLVELIDKLFTKMIADIKIATNDKFKDIVKLYLSVINICSVYMKASYIATYELISVVNKSKDDTNSKTIIEAVSEEDVSEYVKQLNELIPELRKYYNGMKYKTMIEPRKKHIDKMNEYMLGALKRKYILKIPIYKVLNFKADNNREEIIRFIDKLLTIVKQYPNFYLITPNMKTDDEDLFIYITLKEPFGKEKNEGERLASTKDIKVHINESYSNRITVKNGRNGEKIIYVDGKEYSTVDANEVNSEIKEIEKELEPMNESTLTKEDRDKLKTDEFALPMERKYPIHDEEHIRQALKMFQYCPEKDRIKFIRNITNAIMKKNLVGKVTLSKLYKDRDMFPKWMYKERDAKLVEYKNENNYKIRYRDGTDVRTITKK